MASPLVLSRCVVLPSFPVVSCCDRITRFFLKCRIHVARAHRVHAAYRGTSTKTAVYYYRLQITVYYKYNW
eukprot:COSAG02_NODE_124_length_35047_cov_31.554179_36_plen_71_part_00